MADEDALGDESDLSDFEIDDQIKHELNSLMNLEFDVTSSEDDEEEEEKEKEPAKEEEKEEERRPRGDSLERELEMMFMSQQKEVPCATEEGASKDTGLESISDNELDGPESGECDTSDGELPDSPSIVVTVPDTPPMDVQGVEDLSGSSDVELVEYFEQPQKPAREIIIETREPREPSPKKKEKSPTKSKEKVVEKVKKDKKEKGKKKEDGDSEEKRRMKLEKYMARLEMYKAKCREYMKQIAKKYDHLEKDKKNKLKEKIEKSKSKISFGEGKLKSIVREVNRDISPQSSTSSKFDHSSHSSRADKYPYPPMHDERGKRSSSEKERKSKHKKSKRSKSRELKEHKLLYQEYLQYLQLEREKCLESVAEKPKKMKKRKTKSKSPEKRKEVLVPEKKTHRPPILSFSEFCNNRELVSPDRETSKTPNKVKTSHDLESRKERTISIDSAATTATVRSDPVDPTDDDKELFITITDLEHQDKLKKEKRTIEKDKEKIESELQKDPELKSISVFTSVLFKGGADSEGIPFLSTEGRPITPKPTEVKPKKPFIQDTGIDEIYDMNDDLSNISQSSLSPSRSPVPKLHNKALLNFLENQKERQERLRKSSPLKISKSSRSRSKSPRRERSKKRKRKHHSSISTISPSPPPLRPRSPDPVYRKRPSPPAYLKERWKDYPSPPEHRLPKRDHRLPPVLVRRRSRSRTRKVHRSRSSSEERHYRRFRSKSRSRSRSRSKSRSKSRSRTRSPPVLTMVQLSAAEKRRKLREDHERALASLRETIRKPLSSTPLSITITNHGDNYETIRDNYDPVVMNEDSSSNSAEEPSLPPLPPEPPPPAPAPPSDKRDDLVVTTFTSFTLPNTSMVPPPLGYDPIPSFGNWMPPVADIQHPNVMFPPPQMMGGYNAPPQQHFPFMNQPPPPLPYQMSMPPPCHQHYRMPPQAPPGIVSVRQEVKSKSPIVITQISDEDELPAHPVEGKCKHNPLGQNNQTVQEAIDSVKKCLKNCDLKNKDPRLGQVDGRKKSLECSEPGKLDERKVKITLNYKPRPVSDAKQTCLFEPAEEQCDGKSNAVTEVNKSSNDNFTEKNSKIEGIVCKLKDSFNSSTSLPSEEAKCDSRDNLKNPFENKNPGDEPYDPFNISDEVGDSNDNAEDLTKNSPEKHNDRVHSVILKDTTPKLSESEVENINDQINKSFAFILSHSIERKRLTPTLLSIAAKKAEKQKKSELDEKISSLSKMCQLNKERGRNKNADQTPLIKTSQTPSVEKLNQLGQSMQKSGITIDSTAYISSQSDTKSMQSQEKIHTPHITPENNKDNKNIYLVSDPSAQTSLEKLNKIVDESNKRPSEREELKQSYNFDNLEKSGSKKCFNQIVNENNEAQGGSSDKEMLLSEQKVSFDDKFEKSKDFTREDNTENCNVLICKSSKDNEKQAYPGDSQSNSDKATSEQNISLQTHESNLDSEGSRFCNDKTTRAFENSSKKSEIKISENSEFSFGINIDLLKQKEANKSLGKIGFVESKNQHNPERRGNPPLSIPTKGELKRFPTPERSLPNTIKTELHTNVVCDDSKLTKKTSHRFKESKGLTDKIQVEEGIVKPQSTIIESILHDFDESNSFGYDFQFKVEDKTIHDANINVPRTSSPEKEIYGSKGQISDSANLIETNSRLLTSNEIPDEIESSDQVPTTNVYVVESEISQNESYESDLPKSKPQKDLPHRYGSSYEDDSTKAELDNVPSEKTLDVESLEKLSKSKECQNKVKVKEDKKAKSIRRSQRKVKLSKSGIFDNEDDLSSNDTLETKTSNLENRPFQKSLLGKDSSVNQDKIPVENTKNEVDEPKDFSSENSLNILASSKSSNKKLKPCPLSRKSKSYISQNLPLSFDLSVDGHLIRRGFKKLRVSLHRLAQQSTTTARSSDERDASFTVTYSSFNGANSVNPCHVDLVTEHTPDICKTENVCDKQPDKVRTKKRVSFDLNISEIFDDTKFVSENEVSADVGSECEHYQGPVKRNDDKSEKVECCDGLSVESLHNTTEDTNEAEKAINSDSEASPSDSQIPTATAEQLCGEKQAESLSSFYQQIVKTLVSFRGSSLPQMRKRKTVVVCIPTTEEMPAAKILESSKKTSKVNSKKIVSQEISEKFPEQNEKNGNEENSKTELNERIDNKNNASKNCSSENIKSKSCNTSEIQESDNDDSMILDRELSDLAKGCLDSDSNVGDDDSVLNFGIAVSDESSIDSEFDFNFKNSLSKTSTRQKNKISSPINIKKRFVKKLRTSNLDTEINFNKNIAKDEVKLASRKSVKLKPNLDEDDIPQSKISKNKQQELAESPEEILPQENVEETCREFTDSSEIEVSVSTERKACHSSSTEVLFVSKAEKQSKKFRRTGKRQKNVSEKTPTTSKSDSEEVERIISTSKPSEEKIKPDFENEVTTDLNLNVEGDKESDPQTSNTIEDLKINGDEEEKSTNINVCSDKDNESFDSTKKTQNYQSEEPNVNDIEKEDVASNISSSDLEEIIYHTKNAQKNKNIFELNPIKTDNFVQKTSPLRKTRRGKLLEQNFSDKPRQINSEDKTIEQLDESKTKEDINAVSNVRKTRSGRFVDNASLRCGKDRTISQELTVTQEDTFTKDAGSVYSNKACISETMKELNESFKQQKTLKLRDGDHQVHDNENTYDSDTNKSTKVLRVTEEEKFAEELKGDNHQNFNQESKEIPADHRLETDEHYIEINHNQKKEIKKLEDVTSTTPVISPTRNVRKTRMARRKIGRGLKAPKLKKEVDVDSVDGVFLSQTSEHSMRMTRSKKSASEAIEEEKSKSDNSGDNQSLTSETDKINIDIDKDEMKVKNLHVVERTLSTESFEEPLNIVRDKLLADKSKYETAEELSHEYSEGTKNCINNSSVLKNENLKSKVRSCVAEGSANSSQGSTDGSNFSNENNNNIKGSKNDGNESNPTNFSTNDNLSNSGTNNKSYLNMDDTSNSNNTCKSPLDNTNCIVQSLFPPANSQSIYPTVLQQKNALNPKFKEAMRKKRDKAEVDAEIKRRLAEIDELEKLARSQHANVLEKIGARTRSRTINSNQSINIDDEDDVVSISSDDSRGTSVETNETTNTCTKMADVGKSEDLNEEPTTTQEDVIKRSASALTNKSTSPFGILFKGSVSILPIETTQRSKKGKTHSIESPKIDKVENSSLGKTKNDISNISKLFLEKPSVTNQNKKDDLATEKPDNNLPSHATNIVNMEVCNKPSEDDGQIPTSNDEKGASISLSDYTEKSHRDVVSVYQFRESDESEIEEEIHLKQKYNRAPRKRAEIKEQKHKVYSTSPPLNKSQHMQEKTPRKTRHGNYSAKCKNFSRDSSPLNIVTNKPCEASKEVNISSESTSSTNIIPEPDSSTSLIDIPCNHIGNVETPTTFLEDKVNGSPIQGDETNSVVSSNNISQDMTSLPTRGFKQPYRKSLVNRGRRKRRSYFGRCLIPNNNVDNETKESFGDSDDPNITQSEEVVSSSVNSEQIPQDKKKRRRRKTVMDLLMEDSMLSVTRDFPMSPNPYMFSSFYKDIELPNKPSVAKEATVSEQYVKKAGEDRGLPLKPDFLAQKLRILEKLKSISRKNRKTRQCRTLVCYNEDSLPESLVESPVGECVPNNGDGGTLSQDISPRNSLSESAGECSTKTIQEPSFISNDKMSRTIQESSGEDSILEPLKKVQKSPLPKTPLKRGRKSKVTKNVGNVNKSNENETELEISNFCMKGDSPKEKFTSSFLDTSDNHSALNNNQNNKTHELSEFDKLLESKPKDSSRIILPYDYDPGSPRSPSEDKSDDAPDDFFSSLPSPRQSSDDDLSENSNDNQYLPPQCTTDNNTGNILKDHQVLRPGRILCSILKTKIGKMLPYFGDTSSDESDDIDEDVPLSIKLTQFDVEKSEDFESNPTKEDDIGSNSEDSNSLPERTTKRPACKRRRKKFRYIHSSNIRKSVRSTRSIKANLGGKEIASSDIWPEANKKAEVPGNSPNPSSNIPVQLRKSNRKSKTTNSLWKETNDNIKPMFDEVHVEKGDVEENIGSDLLNEKLLDTGEAITFKKKGRPSKTKVLKENNSEKDGQNLNEPKAEVKDEETSYSSKCEHSQNLHYTTKRKCADIDYGDDHIKHINSSAFDDFEADDDTTINMESQEQSTLNLGDLDSSINKSTSLRRTRAKSGKMRLELTTNVEEASDIQTSENDENTNEDCSLEDLPLNKRAVREIIPGKRGRKENPSSGSGTSLQASSEGKVENFHVRENSYLHDKGGRDYPTSISFNDTPPPLIRTRARRAKLMTIDNNDLDPPSLETSIPSNIDNEKDYGGNSLNTETNLESSEMILKDNILPPRKRGRKPKNNDLRAQHEREALSKTPNEISMEDPKSSKTHETEEITENKSSSVELQPLPKKRGRRGKRRITRRKNISSKGTNSDDDSEVEINIPEIPSNDESIAEHELSQELDSNTTNIREDSPDTDNCREHFDYSMQDRGGKRKRMKENQEEIKITNANINEHSDIGNENITESDDDDESTKKRKLQDDMNKDKAPAAGTSSQEYPAESTAYPAQSSANQPFLWNKISAFLNKTTRSVGTQVKVKNMVLKGFETSEPEVSLQSELTLPQVIKTLFEELRFIDSSFSNP